MTVAAADKVAAAALGLGAIAPGMLSNDLTTPVIGVGVTTVAGAVLGTYAAIGYDENRKPNGRVFTLAICTVIIASLAAGVVPKWFGLAWANAGTEAGLAGLYALICYYFLPPAITRGRELIASFTIADLFRFRKPQEPQYPPMDIPSAPPGAEENPTK